MVSAIFVLTQLLHIAHLYFVIYVLDIDNRDSQLLAKEQRPENSILRKRYTSFVFTTNPMN